MLVAEKGYVGYYDPAEDHSKIIYGKGCLHSLAEEVSALGSRVMLVTSQSIEQHTELIPRIRELLGDKLVGVFAGSVAHTPRKAILHAAEFAHQKEPDVILSLGGGSDTDTCKALRLVLWLGIQEASDFDNAFAAYKGGWKGLTAEILQRPMIPQIGMPTTLISAEHTQGVGVTDEATHSKQVFSHPELQSKVIFLDPDLSMTTPPRLWFSTAIKALEHAIAKLSALDRDPIVESIAAHSVRILGSELLRCHADPADPGPRGNLLVASWTCMFGSWSSLVKRMGLSHALGRQVGGVSGASHGLISAVLLPRCMEFNAPACSDAILLAAEALGQDCVGISSEEGAMLAAAEVRRIVSTLGLPDHLRDIGVEEKDLPLIAERTMGDMSMATNPRKVESTEEVLGLLRQAW